MKVLLVYTASSCRTTVRVTQLRHSPYLGKEKKILRKIMVDSKVTKKLKKLWHFDEVRCKRVPRNPT